MIPGLLAGRLDPTPALYQELAAVRGCHAVSTRIGMSACLHNYNIIYGVGVEKHALSGGGRAGSARPRNEDGGGPNDRRSEAEALSGGGRRVATHPPPVPVSRRSAGGS
jgi:hypothetical protein